MLERIFSLKKNRTNVQTEVVAGLTTFLAMSYIIFINPIILSSAGMDRGAVIVATCLAAAIGCFVMAFWANWPVGLAPGMGLNAFFAYTIVHGMGWTWQAALGAVFISGCIFLILTVTGLRAIIVKSIPSTLQIAIPAGIGLFLGLIALKNAGFVIKNESTLVALGDMHSISVMLSVLGFFIIAALEHYKIKGAMLIGILSVTFLSATFDSNVVLPTAFFSAPPSLEPVFFQLDLVSAISQGFLNVIIVIVLVEIFDATGVLTGIAKRAGILANGGGVNRALSADSIAIVCGSVLGTSSTTAYAESMAGIQAGGKTGLTALTIGLLFIVAMFFSPLINIVPSYAIAPALFYVAGLMLSELIHINWDDSTESIPAVLTVFSMPFTFSIANGLAFGFISYSIMMLISGKYRQVHIAVWIISSLFLFKFIFLTHH